MKASRLIIDIETGGLVTDLPVEVLTQYENEAPEHIESHKIGGRKVVIGHPPDHEIWHYMARCAGKNYAHNLIMSNMLRSGKTVMHASVEGGLQEMTEDKLRGRMRSVLPKIQMHSYSQVFKPYEPMKPLSEPYKERFRKSRLKQIQTKNL